MVILLQCQAPARNVLSLRARHNPWRVWRGSYGDIRPGAWLLGRGCGLAAIGAKAAQGGHEVYVPTLTGTGERKQLLSREIDLDTHIQDVIGVIEDEDLCDIVLVGHSYGCMVITGVADRVSEEVASLVYLDAFLPENGQSLFSVLPPDRRLFKRAGRGLVDSADNVGWLRLKRPEVIALWECKSTPHLLATLTQPVQLTGGVGRIKQKMYPGH
jgi:pimeloyl-ACP methyl ester carboxylesterase